MPDREPSRSERSRVIGFRRKQPIGNSRAPSPPSVADLAKYERGEHKDDYRHRMKMNVLGLLVTILLVVSGIWIADTIAEMRKLQDCFLMGGRNCAPIVVPPRHG